MTTDIVKYNALKDASNAMGALFAGAYDSFEHQAKEQSQEKDLAAQQSLKVDGHERLIDGMVALLRKAHLMIEQAEKQISEQEKRVAVLEEAATTDELTGLKNRRGLFDLFTVEIDRCNRGLSQGALLILIDLDNFKSINDTYGHLAGDACLRLVGRALENEVRAMDVAARLGGDEFVLLLSNTTKCDAAQRAQEIASRLNNLAVAWYGEEIPVRASLGLKAFNDGETAQQIFNDADMKLYANKRQRQHEERLKKKKG